MKGIILNQSTLATVILFPLPSAYFKGQKHLLFVDKILIFLANS